MRAVTPTASKISFAENLADTTPNKTPSTPKLKFWHHSEIIVAIQKSFLAVPVNMNRKIKFCGVCLLRSGTHARTKIRT